MERASATLRVRTADQFADHTGLLGMRPSRLHSRFEVTAEGLAFDLPDQEQVRVHLTSSTAPTSLLPAMEVALRTNDVTGVRFDGRTTDGTFHVHFLDRAGNIAAREIEPGRAKWFDPPDRTTGLAFSAVVRGRGELRLDCVSIVLPPPKGRLPRGERLMTALAEARFPRNAMASMDHAVTWIGSEGISVDGHELQLTQPDWTAVDHLDRTTQLGIHGMAMSRLVLDEHPDGTAIMLRLLRDWSDSHPPRPHSTTVMAWNDMAVAHRTMAILAVLDRVRFEQPNHAAWLADMAASHAGWLAHSRNYMANHDHGLYADTALEFAARVLSVHPLSRRWRTLAVQRFESTAGAVIDTGEATVREHSPAYVDAIASLVEERRTNGLRDPLGDIVAGFEHTLCALTTPAASLIPWGDTSLDHGSNRTRPRGVVGFPDTGWSVSHHDDTLVAITSSFHSRAHKHRDELSIVVYDRHGPVIFEAGHPGYAYGSDDRSYAESAQAHSGAVFEPPLARDEPAPFGGAVAMPVARGAWHALMGCNPLLEGAAHHRLVFHHPDMIVIVDLVTGQEVGSVTRLFHVAPDLEVEPVDATAVTLGQRHLTFGPAPLTIDLGVDQAFRHYPTTGSVVTHTTIRATNRGPGAFAAVLAPRPIRALRISPSADDREMAVTVDLDEGTKLRLKGCPGAAPRTLQLETSQAPHV